MKAVTIGTSIKGSYHYEDGTPCQDAHAYGQYKNWNFTIVSDGAGSCPKSHLGSRIAVEESKRLTKLLINRYPDLAFDHRKWALLSSSVFEKVRNRLKRTARKRNLKFEDLSCTLILIIHNEEKLYISHIGDGRAGAKINNKWKSILDPVEGESSGSTCFLTTSFWKEPGYFQSRIFDGHICSVVAMSDGCERAVWLIDRFDEKVNRYEKVNQPFGEFLDYCVDAILVPFSSKNEQLLQVFSDFVKEGNQVLKNEPDDRTMVLSHYIN
ncbi:MAG: protein phosphatase 2C domain-containing protein [Cyclobacteriaceae bacterium]